MVGSGERLGNGSPKALSHAEGEHVSKARSPQPSTKMVNWRNLPWRTWARTSTGEHLQASAAVSSAREMAACRWATSSGCLAVPTSRAMLTALATASSAAMPAFSAEVARAARGRLSVSRRDGTDTRYAARP